MKKTLIATLKIIIPLGIGLYLTWFFISNLSVKDQNDLKNAFFIADYSFVFYSIILMLLSHMSRAYRWKYMLEPLGHQPKFWKMFHSVMIGYLINTKIGAISYNFFHSKTLAIVFLGLGYFYLGETYILVGIILYSHSALDRFLGYGLKYTDSFKNTHLGLIGKN